MVDDVGDTIVESATDHGIDRVAVSITYTFPDNVEILILNGSEEINGTVNLDDDYIVGNDDGQHH
jgi:hypothetical protein